MTIKEIENDQLRREVLVRRVLCMLRDTIQVYGRTPETPTEDVLVAFTDASAVVVAQLCEAVEILEDIIFASDGCVGHKHCAHSMEPWQRARALLAGKWEADIGRRETWPDTKPDIRAVSRPQDGEHQ